MNDISADNRKAFRPHGNNLDAKVKNGKRGSKSFRDKKYLPFVKSMSKIDFNSGKISEFKKASELIDGYYKELSLFVEKHKIDTRSGIKSSFIEEISKYLFENHPIVIKECLLFKNTDICTGLFFSKDTIKTTDKDVDFCICREKKILINDEDSLSVKIPIISVECKTYLDGTMFNEVIDSTNRLHSSSPDSASFVLMLWNEVGKEAFTIRRKATSVLEFFSLMKKPKTDLEKIEIKTDPKVLMKYYKMVSDALEDYFKDYSLPEYGTYLN